MSNVFSTWQAKFKDFITNLQIKWKDFLSVRKLIHALLHLNVHAHTKTKQKIKTMFQAYSLDGREQFKYSGTGK